jgi:hypothetical protein
MVRNAALDSLFRDGMIPFDFDIALRKKRRKEGCAAGNSEAVMNLKQGL